MENKANQLYDLTELRATAGGDESFIQDMIRIFITENEKVLQEIGQLTVTGSYISAKAMLHKMKISFMVMGVTKVMDVIEQIERLDLATAEKSVISDHFHTLGRLLEKVNEQLRMVLT